MHVLRSLVKSCRSGLPTASALHWIVKDRPPLISAGPALISERVPGEGGTWRY